MHNCSPQGQSICCLALIRLDKYQTNPCKSALLTYLICYQLPPEARPFSAKPHPLSNSPTSIMLLHARAAVHLDTMSHLWNICPGDITEFMAGTGKPNIIKANRLDSANTSEWDRAPAEVMHEIMKYLSFTRDLKICRLTNRLTRDVAAYYLFRGIHVGKPKALNGPAPRFLSTSHLARLVRRFSCEGGEKYGLDVELVGFRIRLHKMMKLLHGAKVEHDPRVQLNIWDIWGFAFRISEGSDIFARRCTLNFVVIPEESSTILDGGMSH
jgi:hypothetical protein